MARTGVAQRPSFGMVVAVRADVAKQRRQRGGGTSAIRMTMQSITALRQHCPPTRRRHSVLRLRQLAALPRRGRA